MVSLDALSDTQKNSLRHNLGEGQEVHRVLLALVSLDGEGDLDEIAAKAGMGKIATRHGLDYLTEQDLLTSGSNRWFLTAAGRSLAVRLGLIGVFQTQTGPTVEVQ